MPNTRLTSYLDLVILLVSFHNNCQPIVNNNCLPMHDFPWAINVHSVIHDILSCYCCHQKTTTRSCSDPVHCCSDTHNHFP